MAKTCRLGNQYCKKARFLWADVQEALDAYNEDHDPKKWKAVDKAIATYYGHRRKCSGGRMVRSN